MVDLSDKDFKTIAIKMLSELKEVVEKAKKTIMKKMEISIKRKA